MLDTIIHTYSTNFLFILYVVGTLFIGAVIWDALTIKKA
jgi:hypothetical protein